MALEFRFPDVGEGITEGRLVKWLVKEGDAVKADQPVAEVETDKATVEIPAPQAGTILKRHVNEGATLKVGDILVTIGEKGEKASAAPAAKSAPQTQAAPKPAPAPKEEAQKTPEKEERASTAVGEVPTHAAFTLPAQHATQAAQKGGAKKTLAMPRVRALAKQLGIDLNAVKGSGPQGAITEGDVRAAAHQTPTTHHPQVTDEHAAPSTPKAAGPKVTMDRYGKIIKIPLSGVRKVIAEKMTKANQIPTAVAMMEADITDISQIREKKKGPAEKKGIKLTLLPFIVRATVAALKKHPYLNAHFDKETQVVTTHSYYHIGVAVDTAAGLMVPVVKKADTKSILDIAHDIEMMAKDARARTIKLEDLRDSTFTITNWGSIGGSFGVPVINYPETAILGVGRAEWKPVIRGKSKKPVVRLMMPLSLSFDHRVLDGAMAAYFLKDVVRHLEDPDQLLVDID